MNAIEQLIKNNRVLICCGSGGVGKTTTSAALALKAAAMGKKAVVITIDPAKRLATSLGLESLSNQVLDLTKLAQQAFEPAAFRGQFFAVMPDTAQTFDSFVRSMAQGNERLVERVVQTSIYKIFAKDFSGTNEYMAMEKLHHLYQDQSFDCIVLDTPPSVNTKFFLEAPQTLATFFDDQIIQWFVSGKGGVVATGLKKVLEVLEKLTGRGFVNDLINFTSALFELRSQFRQNLHAVAELFISPQVKFIMISCPERHSFEDTKAFIDILNTNRYPFWGLMMNRVLSQTVAINNAADLQQLVLELKEYNGAVQFALDQMNTELRVLETIRNSGYFANKAMVCLSEQNEDIHSIQSLARLF